MRHERFAGGESQMEVDHFDPTLSGQKRHVYRNLYLASAHCNGKKSDYWPTAAERRVGIRLLDPCAEIDYGKHIFEDPCSHELVGITPAGRYHIDICDLNAKTFVDERRRRAKLRRYAKGANIAGLAGDWNDLTKFLGESVKIVEELIPDIPAPPLPL